MADRRAVSVWCVLLFVASGAFAQANFTGTWSGSFTGKGNCSEVMLPVSGTAIAQLVQAGSGVSGTITATVNTSCGTETEVFPVAATVSGSTISFPVSVERGGTMQVTMTVNGTSISFTIASPTFFVNGTLTQTSNAAPDSTYSGMYAGTYMYTKAATCGDPNHPGCLNLTGSVSSSGALEVTLLQSGTTATGTAVAHNLKDIDDDGHGNCTIVSGDQVIPFAGTFNGNILTIPDDNNTITITFSGGSFSGSSSNTCPPRSLSFNGTRTSSGAPPASITNFAANPDTMSAGSSTTLVWSTVNATSVSIDHGIGTKPSNGSVSVSPLNSTTYTLTATGIGGNSVATATVTVTGTGPRVVAANLPSGMLQATGQSGAGDSFTLANTGTSAAKVSLAQTGSFFTINPASVTIQPQSTQSITIQAAAQPAGTYDGFITVSGDGLPSGPIVAPVHLLVAAPPSGSVNPQPAAARVDVSAPAGQNPTGSASFKNTGTAAMNGIAVSDAAWLVPQSGAITISPGETKNVTFTINRARRPDASAPAGGASGNLSLRFLGSPLTAASGTLETTPTSSISVSIVDVVKPTVSSGTPPPLAQNELALFVAGHGSTLSGISADLLLSNRGGNPLADLKLYSPAASQVAALSPLAANLGVTLPAVSTNVFGVEGGGSLMLRGSLNELTAAAMRFVNPIASNLYGTAVPVFRSDRGVGSGGRIVLAGVEQSAATATSIFVQELSGNATTAEIQPYDANGTPVGTKASMSLNGFQARSDGAATVIAGTRSVVITNTGSGRINAYARTVDQSTGDGWVVTDPAVVSGSDGPFVMPLLSLNGVSAQTDVYVTNTTASPVNATMSVTTPSPHRRAIRTESLESGSSGQQQLTIQPRQTQKTTISPVTGYVTFSGPAASIAASGRITVTSSGATFGASLPVLPLSAALGNGQMKRFAGVGDASPRSIANSAPGTYRTTLMLLETTGLTATVRVSIWYTFPAGGLVSGQTVSSKNFVVAGSQVLVINDLARAIIGSQRDSYGDLRDMQVDIEVVDGTGTVLPFIQSIDNRSGDLVVRAE